MTKKKMITSGQFFLLVFISRISLIMLYSSRISAQEQLQSFLLPLLLLTPLLLITILPLIYLQSQKQLSIAERPVIGKPLQRITATAYSGYYLLSAVYGIVVMLGFMNQVIPEGIEPKIILVLIMTGCVYSASKGIEPSARMSAVVMVLIVLTMVLSLWFLSSSYNPDNLSPLSAISVNGLSDGIIFLLSRINSVSTIFVLYPSVKGNIKNGFIGYTVFSCIFLVTMLMFFTGTSGEFSRFYELQVYHSIEGSANMQRLDPVIILVIVCSFFCHISLLLIAFSESLRYAFPNTQNSRLWITTAFILSAIVILLPEAVSRAVIDRNVWMIINTIFCFSIPAVILCIGLLFTGNRKKRLAIRTISLVLSAVFFAGIVSGCGSVQLNQRIIVQGIGIDRFENDYKLTFIALNTDDQENTNSSVLLYSNGSSPEDAINALERQSGKKVLLSQCLFILINRDAAKNRSQTLDYFCERRDIQTGINLIVSEDDSRPCIEKAKNEYNLSAESVSMGFDSNAVEQTVAHFTLSDYISEITDDNNSILIPRVFINKELHCLEISGSFVSEEDNIYTLSKENTALVLLMKNKTGSLYCDSISEKTTHSIMKYNTIIIPRISDNRLMLEIEIRLKPNENQSKEYKALLKQKIEEKLSGCITIIINKNGSDLLNLRKSLKNTYSQNKAIFRDFRSLLKNSETELIVNVE